VFTVLALSCVTAFGGLEQLAGPYPELHQSIIHNSNSIVLRCTLYNVLFYAYVVCTLSVQTEMLCEFV
jgi:hypothetical protein